MTKVRKIINEELQGLVTEILDNDGGSFQPPGLDPKVVKLFEDINDDFYQSTLDDEYFKEISKKFPNYNSSQSEEAADYIVKEMKKKYPDQDWNNIESDMRSKVHGGIT